MPLRGVNLPGWLAAGASPERVATAPFAGAADFARLVSWRFTHVRLPFDVALLDRLGAGDALDGVLGEALRAGLRCVLAPQLDQEQHRALFQEETRWQRLAQRWRALGERYRAWPDGLLYDLLDQPAAPDDLAPEMLSALGAVRLSPAAAARPAVPGATGARAWNALAARLTQAIRDVDPRHLIVVQSSGRASAAAFSHLRPTRDPRTIYSFHCFEPPAFTRQGVPSTFPLPQTPPLSPLLEERGTSATISPFAFPSPSGEGPGERSDKGPVTYPGVIDGEQWNRERLRALLEPALAFRSLYDAPLYLGACGVSAAAPRQGQLTWVRSVLSLCRAYDIGWAYWAYRDERFGLVCDAGPCSHLAQYQNPQRLDYDLLGILQSET